MEPTNETTGATSTGNNTEEGPAENHNQQGRVRRCFLGFPECGKTFTSRLGFVLHLWSKEHRNDIICGCGCKFKNIHQLCKHEPYCACRTNTIDRKPERLHRPQRPISRPWKCTFCNRRYKSKELMTNHQEYRCKKRLQNDHWIPRL